MDTPQANLMDFIHALVERLMMNSDFPRDQVVALLDPVLEDLRAMRGPYDEACPEGAEAVRSLMVEMLDLYEQSLLEITAFLGDEEDGHLQLAVAMAEEANDLLSAVEHVIQTNKDVLSEMVDA